MNCYDENDPVLGWNVNIAESTLNEDRLGLKNCPSAEDFDVNKLRTQVAWDESLEDNDELVVLAGRQQREVHPFALPEDNFDEYVETRRRHPLRVSEEELDDLAVLSGISQRTTEEMYLQDLEEKLDSLVSQVRSTVRIIKTLMRERRRPTTQYQ